ncbi:MAG TPA: TetR/AcrR family transcriptional regulator [Burkholderiaceae bacterium]|jgi:AcrR family transcriptional regulator|nr:TetR/AcrR family transcriptional regulator [Burkholderiaceae bacterium]
MRPRSKAHATPRPRVRRGNLDDAERLRTELIAAARRLYSEGGLAAVSVRAVAARVGVSPMSTYRYFADKAELLAGLWQSVFDELYEVALQALVGVQGARQRHRVFAETVMHYWETHLDNFCLVQGFTSLGQDRQAKSQLAGDAVYGKLRQLGVEVTEALAREVGGDAAQARIASEVRLAMTLGYLHGTLVTTRYPWSDRRTLRAVYLEQIERAVEDCLRGGAPAPAAPVKRRLRAAAGGAY